MVDLHKKNNLCPHFLVREYGDEIYKFCRRITFNKEDGEDLFQNTFLKILETGKEITDQSNIRQFLYRTAVTCWKDQKRKYARRERIAPSVPFEENTDVQSGNMEEVLLDMEEKMLVRSIVASLPEKYRLPTALYYGAEMKLNEIAETLSLPVGTVKNRLFTARQMVKEELMKYER